MYLKTAGYEAHYLCAHALTVFLVAEQNVNNRFNFACTMYSNGNVLVILVTCQQRIGNARLQVVVSLAASLEGGLRPQPAA